MIIIEDLDFKMEQVKTTPFFDLSLMVPVNEGTEKERYDLKIVGYSLPFETCIKKIVAYKLSEYDKTVSLKEYFELYKKEVDEILTLMKISEI